MRQLLLAFAASLIPSFATAQSACHPADYQGPKLQHRVTKIVTGNDTRSAADRLRYGLSASDSTGVVVVTDTAICSAAAVAYARNVENDSTITVTTRQVHVVKAGHRYIVLDPSDRSSGSWRTFVVFSLTWDVIAVFAG